MSRRHMACPGGPVAIVEPGTYAAAASHARLVQLEGLACSPCFERKCPLGHFRCMNDLTPERVLAEIECLGI